MSLEGMLRGNVSPSHVFDLLWQEHELHEAFLRHREHTQVSGKIYTTVTREGVVISMVSIFLS